MTPEQVRAALAGELPPATLVLGPGAWDLVAALPPDPDWIRMEAVDAAAARQACDMAAAAGRRVLALRLDGVSAQVQNMLLKVLEESPEAVRFVLAAETFPLRTVMSRCQVLVLWQRLQAEAPDPADKTAVGAAIRAARSRQPRALSSAVRGWLPPHARLLSVWAAEAATGRWQVFGPEFAPGVTRDQALRLLAELARYPGARLGSAVALDRVFCQG